MDSFSSQIQVTSKMSEAINFALEHHLNQRDKGGNLYFGHPLRVALRVLYLGEDYFITAILHDVCEDCGVSLETIEARWGKVIRDAVDSVTRRTLPTKETYMTLIDRASQNDIGREVKLEDVEDNSAPERIAVLPPESRDILKRYHKARIYLQTVKDNLIKESLKKQHEQMLIDGGGA